MYGTSQEHQGNDPTTQLVPSGAAGTGWSKPEEPPPQQQPAQPEVRQSALTAGSNWASTQRSGSTGWVPPVREGPFAAGSSTYRSGSFPLERQLNPEEYPTLGTTASEKPPSKRQQELQAARHQVRALEHCTYWTWHAWCSRVKRHTCGTGVLYSQTGVNSHVPFMFQHELRMFMHY